MLTSNLLRQLDIQDVMVFLCLYDHKSARRTAEMLSISQPTVSYSLKRLRSCFGDVLFDLGQSKFDKTPCGCRLDKDWHGIVSDWCRSHRPSRYVA